jgi:hypothetical protein
MESRDQSQKGVAAVPDLGGFQGGEPAALLFVQAAHEQIDVMMAETFGMVLARQAARALTNVDGNVGHDATS